MRNYHRLGAEIGIATAEHIEAIQHAREFSKHAYVSEQDLYDAGRLMVRCAKLVNVNRRDLHPTVLEADRVATYESYLADAAKTLELALDRGGLDAWRLQSDADLQPLRESRYFQQLRERFRVLREGVFWDSVEYPF